MHSLLRLLVVTAVTAVTAITTAPVNAAAPAGPLRYTIRVDPARANEYAVSLRTRVANGPVTLVMARHPEYDDRFWRYVTDLHATSNGRALSIVREDSARWEIVGDIRGELSVDYRIVMPVPPPGLRPSWRPYVGSNVALVGGPHSFLYPLSRSNQPIHVHVDAPATWKIATALRAESPRDWVAPDIFTLIDSPILTGTLKIWTFAIDGVPHRVAYAPLPDAAPFDTTAFVSLVKKLARHSADIFNAMPYHDFTFLFQDGAYAGLEHATSVNLGAPSATLARNVAEEAQDFEHEFFHTWNLVAIHPVNRGGAREGPWPLATGLWLSEGVTMYYTDVVLRRAAIDTTSRSNALAGMISSYFSNPGNTHVAPETASMYSDEPPGGTGDYTPGVHLQGQMIATILDLMIRDSTSWHRSLDDVMRTLYRTRSARGFTSTDVVRAVDRACSCNSAPFFQKHVAGNQPLDFTHALQTIGMRLTLSQDTTRSDAGAVQPDLANVWGYVPQGKAAVHLIIGDPNDSWGRAGLHTNDEVVSWNGKPVTGMNDFRTVLRGVRTGETVVIVVKSKGVERAARVTVGAEVRTGATITNDPDATSAQRKHRSVWDAGKQVTTNS